MAPMPVAKVVAARPPSSIASLDSSAAVVGLPWRAYTKPALLPWNVATRSREAA